MEVPGYFHLKWTKIRPKLPESFSTVGAAVVDVVQVKLELHGAEPAVAETLRSLERVIGAFRSPSGRP